MPPCASCGGFRATRKLTMHHGHTPALELEDEWWNPFTRFDGDPEPVAPASSGTPRPVAGRDGYSRWVQAALNQVAGAGLTVDGVLGARSRAAIVAFQRGRGLTADGVVGPRTEAALVAAGAPPPPGGSGGGAGGPAPGSGAPTGAAPGGSAAAGARLASEAARLGVEIAALQAVLEVESGGRALGASGRAILRLEAHVLLRRASDALRPVFARYFRHSAARGTAGQEFRPERGEWAGYHGDQRLEWTAFEAARAIHEATAISSASWGLGQIMGFHWRRLGFVSPRAFMEAQATEQGQLDTLIAFITSDRRLVDALRARDWRAFARVYNGPGNVDVYSQRIAAAYARLGGR